jgi:spore coat protein H
MLLEASEHRMSVPHHSRRLPTVIALPSLTLVFAGSVGSCDNGRETPPGAIVSSTGGEGGTAGDSGATAAGDGGAAATAPIDPIHFVPRSEIGVVPFDPATILEYRITMDPALYQEMEEHGNDEQYRVASLQVRGGEVEAHYAEVGFRYKGEYSLHHCWDDYAGVRSHSGECAKLNTRIKFNEYDANGRFYGLKHINLHAMAADDTKLRERLAYELFAEFGVDASRTAFARLIINDGEPLFVLAVEEVDGRYTAHHYPDGGDGNLYKQIWPRASLPESTVMSSLRTNDDPDDNPDVSDFIEFGNVVAATTESSFQADLAGYVDLNHMLRYVAVDRAIKNWDGITAFYWPDRPQNYYWYHDDSAADLFHLIPWDMDKTWWEYDPYMDPTQYIADRQVPNWNVRPLSCSPISVWNSAGTITVIPPGCDHFINLLAATLWDEFAAVGRELLDTRLRYEVLTAKITAWAEQIAPLVDEDPHLSRPAWDAAVTDFPRVVQKAIDDFEAHLGEGYVVEQ